MKYPNTKILIFCKAPVAGLNKTRLVPPLSMQQATDLHQSLATRIIDCVLDAQLAPMELWCYPDISGDFFDHYRARGVQLFKQSGVDLGERMHHAIETSLASTSARRGVDNVLLVGTDCPTLDVHYLESALSAMQDNDAVLGPAEDGGYGLIGLRHAERELFTGIEWSTDRVGAMTAAKLDSLGFKWTRLEQLWDVDRPEDLQRLMLLRAEHESLPTGSTQGDFTLADDFLQLPVILPAT